MVLKFAVLAFVLAFATVECDQQTVAGLDIPFLSRLRFETKWAAPLKQCTLFWLGIRDKLNGLSEMDRRLEDESTLVNRVDLKLLHEVHEALSMKDWPYVNRKLEEFVARCIVIVAEYRGDDPVSLGTTMDKNDPSRPEVYPPRRPPKVQPPPSTKPIDTEPLKQPTVNVTEQLMEKIMKLEWQLAENQHELAKISGTSGHVQGEGDCKFDLDIVRESIKQIQSECDERVESFTKEGGTARIGPYAEGERIHLESRLADEMRKRDRAMEENKRLKAELRDKRIQYKGREPQPSYVADVNLWDGIKN